MVGGHSRVNVHLDIPGTIVSWVSERSNGVVCVWTVVQRDQKLCRYLQQYNYVKGISLFCDNNYRLTRFST